MDFIEQLANQLENYRLKKKAFFGIGDKPKAPTAPAAPKTQPSVKSILGDHYEPPKPIVPGGAEPHISDKIDEDGNMGPKSW